MVDAQFTYSAINRTLIPLSFHVFPIVHLNCHAHLGGWSEPEVYSFKARDIIYIHIYIYIYICIHMYGVVWICVYIYIYV